MLGAKHRVGPAHMPCQSSFKSLLPKSSSQPCLLMRLDLGVSNTLKEERKSSRKQGSFGLGERAEAEGELKQRGPFGHCEKNTGESFRRCSPNEEIESESVRV
ncbi:hypothetical protein ACB092_05G282300 [Castanea dentata]